MRARPHTLALCLSSALSATGCGAADTTVTQEATDVAVARAALRPAFVAYHDVTGAHHQARFNDLYGRGYRISSLSVYGSPADPRYAAVWILRSGPSWAAFHDRRASDYQSLFNSWTARGFHPTSLSVSGTAADAVIAGIFEERRGPAPLTRLGLRRGSYLDTDTIEHWLKWAHENRQRPRWLSVYGTAADPRYAVIMGDNGEGLSWDASLLDDSAQHQARTNALVTQHARPDFVTVSGFGRHAAIFHDDLIGPWVARHDLTSAGYQREVDLWVPLGYYPYSVQAGGGTWSSARFSVVFTQGDTRAPSVRRDSQLSCDAGKTTCDVRNMPVLWQTDPALDPDVAALGQSGCYLTSVAMVASAVLANRSSTTAPTGDTAAFLATAPTAQRTSLVYRRSLGLAQVTRDLGPLTYADPPTCNPVPGYAWNGCVAAGSPRAFTERVWQGPDRFLTNEQVKDKLRAGSVGVLAFFWSNRVTTFENSLYKVVTYQRTQPHKVALSGFLPGAFPLRVNDPGSGVRKSIKIATRVATTTVEGGKQVIEVLPENARSWPYMMYQDAPETPASINLIELVEWFRAE